MKPILIQGLKTARKRTQRREKLKLRRSELASREATLSLIVSAINSYAAPYLINVTFYASHFTYRVLLQPEPIFVGKTCTQCRMAKVKCDKHQPCARCCRRGYVCCAQERGPGRPPNANTSGSGAGRKNSSKSTQNSRRAKRRKGGKNARREDLVDEQFSYPMPPFPVVYPRNHYPGNLEMQYAHQPGFPYHPAYSQMRPHQQHPFTANSILLIEQFLGKVTSGSFTKDKIDDVVAYLSDLAIKRNSVYLAQKVLEALTLLLDSEISAEEIFTQGLPSKQFALITALSRGQVDVQDQAKGLLAGKVSVSESRSDSGAVFNAVNTTSHATGYARPSRQSRQDSPRSRFLRTSLNGSTILKFLLRSVALSTVRQHSFAMTSS